MLNPVAQPETTDAAWKGLYRLGGWAALIAAIVFRRWLGAELALFQSLGLVHFGSIPGSGSVAGWFALLQTSPLAGLTLLNVFDLVNYALVGLIFLGLCAALGQANQSAMTLAMALGFLGIAVYFASNQAFGLLSLSSQYAAATTEMQRAMLLAAGQALLTTNSFGAGGTGVSASFFLVTLAGLIMATVMLRSRLRVFSKTTAYVGILANVFGLGALITLAFAPPLTAIPVSASAPFLLIWYLLIARRLLQLAAGASAGKTA